MIKFTKPWEFSLIIIILYIYIIILIIIKKKNKFKLTLIASIIYITIHTKIDFFSQHVIFINKIQEVIIKHIIPLIINKFIKLNKKKINKLLFFKNNKYINYYIFLINQIQIIPPIIFYIMINNYLYKFKNIINLLIYLLYWTILFNNKILINKKKFLIILVIKIIIKIIIGNYIYFKDKNIYNIYIICGKINKINPIEDQQISGLITWIINSMMIIINIIIF